MTPGNQLKPDPRYDVEKKKTMGVTTSKISLDLPRPCRIGLHRVVGTKGMKIFADSDNGTADLDKIESIPTVHVFTYHDLKGMSPSINLTGWTPDVVNNEAIFHVGVRPTTQPTNNVHAKAAFKAIAGIAGYPHLCINIPDDAPNHIDQGPKFSTDASCQRVPRNELLLVEHRHTSEGRPKHNKAQPQDAKTKAGMIPPAGPILNCDAPSIWLTQ
jgi:hypothetical protein